MVDPRFGVASPFFSEVPARAAARRAARAAKNWAESDRIRDELTAAGGSAVSVEADLADPVAIAAMTTFAVVGGGTAFYQMYLAEQRKDPATPIIPSLRKMSGGGAPMPPEIYEEIKREFGVKTCHGYGMTECPMICEGSPHDTDEQLANTVGKPVVGLQMRIVKEDGSVGGPDEDGEVRLKGPMVFQGYTDPAATTEASPSTRAVLMSMGALAAMASWAQVRSWLLRIARPSAHSSLSEVPVCLRNSSALTAAAATP